MSFFNNIHFVNYIAKLDECRLIATNGILQRRVCFLILKKINGEIMNNKSVLNLSNYHLTTTKLFGLDFSNPQVFVRLEVIFSEFEVYLLNSWGWLLFWLIKLVYLEIKLTCSCLYWFSYWSIWVSMAKWTVLCAKRFML